MMRTEIGGGFQRALRRCASRRLDRAGAARRRIRAAEPAHPGAPHLLGLVAFRTGHHDAAFDLVHGAAARAPAVPDFHAKPGAVRRAAGRTP